MKKTTSHPSHLLLVDDDRHILDCMSQWLREQGFQVDIASSVDQANAAVTRNPYDLVLCDIRLGEGDGFNVLDHIQEVRPRTTVVMITGYGTVETGITALRRGAFDLLTKPLIDEELLIAIERALDQRQVVAENQNLKEQLDVRFGMDNIIGNDYRMNRVFDVIGSVSDTRATVLVTGESGTGKSMIARAIHRQSSRRDKPFVEIACGALPETLLESELFGHVAGAFTGATGNKTGKFKQADGGTIFLDEIGTAPPSMQVKLLRVLQDLEFEPVGGTETQRVDVRVILATNESLKDAVADGRFRQDLYYRINVINVELPSLRDRVSDIPKLANHFLETVREETNRPVYGITDEAMAVLQGYRWPGNVRELQNVVERAVLLGRHETIEISDLAEELTQATPRFVPRAAGRTLKEALEEPERQIILEVLQSCQWNRNETADTLGINRTTLYKKMKRLGLEHEVSS